jgi:2-aminoadipate transaminase
MTRIYNFGAGNPDPGSFPAAELAEATARVLARDGQQLVVYPDPRGHAPLREIGAVRFAKNHGMPMNIDDMALTTGSMQAISLVCQAFLKPGDTIITEEFSYSGSINCFRKYEANMVGIPVDDDGMDTDALEEALKDLDRRGTLPKFVYTIATNQNPTGTMMPVHRREKLLALTQRYGIPVVDDDCYADLLFGIPAPTSFYALDPESVIYIGSFSKIMGPGMRLGFFAARDEWLQKVLYWKIDGGTNNFASFVAAEYFKDHLWDHVDEINGIVKGKLDVVIEQLDDNKDAFPYHSKPKGGLFIWMSVPDDADPNRILELATERGIRYGTGKAFHSGGQDVHYLRIAFGWASPDDFREGIPLLAQCVRDAQKIPVVAST